MFERLTEKIQGAVKSLRGQGRITETNIQESLRAVRLALLDAATSLNDLRLPGLHLEALKGGRKGQYSIRINDRFRICFEWRDGDAYAVEIVDYH